MTLFQIISILITLAAAFSYINYCFIELPMPIGVLLTVTYVIVVFSIVVQGLTIGPLLKYYLGISQGSDQVR